MSEQQEAIEVSSGGASGSVDAGSTPSSAVPGDKAAGLAVSILEAPAIAPDHETQPKADSPRIDGPKVEATRSELTRPEPPRMPGKLMIMSPTESVWHDHPAGAEVKAETHNAAPPAAAPKRSFGTMAAMLALATLAGAIGGALATSGFTHVADASVTPPSTGALEASIARIDADVLALKTGLDHTSKQGVTQFNKTNDRLDKIEKAQAEPAARLAKLTEAVDKLRVAPAPAAVVAAAPAPAAATPAPKEVTGSVTPPQQAVAAATPTAPAAAKPEVGRLPAVEGWSLAEVGYGGALIQNRRNTFEVYAGDYIPGLGRIDAIRKQDGQWVVVTSKGLVVRR